ncbi:hypothetical protein PGTUg99_036335 [Puccinia graminis f. sp. tritici]|uniref:Uncharacterized protein n=1 Tax=Puccinia graminis f. sp. tritici TaxID=56615 RepID=A0A5B0RHI4_PUCGR|nr:hypothetical protein PGTUg99_036335 [Puccinia graminis f. sp. tritici]
MADTGWHQRVFYNHPATPSLPSWSSQSRSRFSSAPIVELSASQPTASSTDTTRHCQSIAYGITEDRKKYHLRNLYPTRGKRGLHFIDQVKEMSRNEIKDRSLRISHSAEKVCERRVCFNSLNRPSHQRNWLWWTLSVNFNAHSRLQTASACSISRKAASKFSARLSRITGLSSISLIHIGRLLPLVGLGRLAPRIAENRKKCYLSKKLLDLRTQILPSRPSPTDGSRRPMWIGEIEDGPVIRETLAKKLEAALREIEQADAVCSREWALKFTDKVRHITSSAGVMVDCGS